MLIISAKRCEYTVFVRLRVCLCVDLLSEPVNQTLQWRTILKCLT